MAAYPAGTRMIVRSERPHPDPVTGEPTRDPAQFGLFGGEEEP